ncbi:MAG TPA: hypothetical protein VFR43_08465 [Gaiellaceae bacterium]|nr:hypothetical protein [Gaiellaceae bacterium]
MHVSWFDRFCTVCAATLAALAFCANASADEGSAGLVQPVDVSAIVESALADVPLPQDVVAMAVETAQAAETAPVPAPAPAPPPRPPQTPAKAPRPAAKTPAAAPDPPPSPARSTVSAGRYQPAAPQYHAALAQPVQPPPAPDPPPVPAAEPERPAASACAGSGDALELVCGALAEVSRNSGLKLLEGYQLELLQYQPLSDVTSPAGPFTPVPDAVGLLELGDSIVGALEDQLVEPLAGSAPPVQHAPERRAPGPAARTVEPLHGLGPGPPATPQRVRGPEAGQPAGPSPPVAALTAAGSERRAPPRAGPEPARAHRAAVERPPPPEPLTPASTSGAPAGGASAGPFGGGAGGAGAVASLTVLFLLALLDQLRRLRLESLQPRSVHVASFPERPG